MKHYDIIVLGGGLSGTAAAIAAARQGKRVLLIEKNGYLGGTATAGLVNPFMRSETTKPFGGSQIRVNQGIYLETLDRLKILNSLNDNAFNEEILKLLLDRMCKESGVSVLFHATFVNAIVEDDHIVGITVISKVGMTGFSADIYIDSSGDADLAADAGCLFSVGREEDGLCQPMTLSVRISNIDTDIFFSHLNKIKKLHRVWIKSDECIYPCEDIIAFKHPVARVVHFNCTRVTDKNPLDIYDKSDAERIAREQAYDLYTFLRKYAPGCEKAECHAHCLLYW